MYAQEIRQFFLRFFSVLRVQYWISSKKVPVISSKILCLLDKVRTPFEKYVSSPRLFTGKISVHLIEDGLVFLLDRLEYTATFKNLQVA